MISCTGHRYAVASGHQGGKEGDSSQCSGHAGRYRLDASARLRWRATSGARIRRSIPSPVGHQLCLAKVGTELLTPETHVVEVCGSLSRVKVDGDGLAACSTGNLLVGDAEAAS